MPTLVHLADERDSKKILNAGIKVRKNGQGVYCMPVLPDFYVTHQWLRELKRFGAKSIVGVYFKIDSSELVYAGKFSEPHKHISLGEAIKEIMSLKDPLGYELIIDRKIEAKEIIKIKPLPHNVGWRYLPGSNGTIPCTCEFCLRSRIKGKRMKESVESKKKD